MVLGINSQATAFFASFLVMACSGPSEREQVPVLPVESNLAVSENAPRFATGVIGNACLIHGKRNASRARCGCIQAAADMTLTPVQQKQAIGFFRDPEQLEKIKRSDSPGNEKFWRTWETFTTTAEELCETV